jgi:hypothetical protein
VERTREVMKRVWAVRRAVRRAVVRVRTVDGESASYIDCLRLVEEDLQSARVMGLGIDAMVICVAIGHFRTCCGGLGYDGVVWFK